MLKARNTTLVPLTARTVTKPDTVFLIGTPHATLDLGLQLQFVALALELLNEDERELSEL
jgi:hypothetical protein